MTSGRAHERQHRTLLLGRSDALSTGAGWNPSSRVTVHLKCPLAIGMHSDHVCCEGARQSLAAFGRWVSESIPSAVDQGPSGQGNRSTYRVTRCTQAAGFTRGQADARFDVLLGGIGRVTSFSAILRHSSCWIAASAKRVASHLRTFHGILKNSDLSSACGNPRSEIKIPYTSRRRNQSLASMTHSKHLVRRAMTYSCF